MNFNSSRTLLSGYVLKRGRDYTHFSALIVEKKMRRYKIGGSKKMIPRKVAGVRNPPLQGRPSHLVDFCSAKNDPQALHINKVE